MTRTAVSDKYLDSLGISATESDFVRLTFRHNFNLEASSEDPNLGFDGGVLELSIDGGQTFQDITCAGAASRAAATTARSALIGEVRLLVVGHGAATRVASSRRW